MARREAGRVFGNFLGGRPISMRLACAGLLIYEGVDVVELAPELGHSPGHVPEVLRARRRGIQGLPRCPAVEVIREARDAVAAGAVPPRYLDEDPTGVGGIWQVRDTAR